MSCFFLFIGFVYSFNGMYINVVMKIECCINGGGFVILVVLMCILEYKSEVNGFINLWSLFSDII